MIQALARRDCGPCCSATRLGAGVLGQTKAGRVVVIGAGFSGLAAAFELGAGRIRRDRRRGAQPRRRTCHHLQRLPARQNRRRRRRAGRPQPSALGSIRRAVQAEARRGDRRRLRGADRPRRQTADSRRIGNALGRARSRRSPASMPTARPSRTRSNPGVPPNAEALDKRSMGSFIDGLDASPLCKLGLHTMVMADNGVITAVAELPRESGDGSRRRRRQELLGRQRSTSLRRRQPAARDAARRRRRHRRRCCTRTPVRAVAITDRGGA